RRRRLFTDPALVDSVGSQFLQTAEECALAVLAYCFMPDHLHAVVLGGAADADLRRFLDRAKQRTGYMFARTHGGRLWQPGAFERTIRENEDVLATIDYVITNPVRASLVTSARDYPHWGSQIYSREQLLDTLAGRARA